MSTINFVPNDYVEQKESTRANYMYLLLLLAMVGAIGVTFSFIKMRQRSIQTELDDLDNKMMAAQQQIIQMEQLKVKGKTMMKTMVMTAELLEPVPRSIILASLTNQLPGGVSLLDFQLEEKELAQRHQPTKAKKPDPTSSQYDKKAASAGTDNTEDDRPKTETKLVLQGIAPSDIEVASYIARLSTSLLLNKIELVESKERLIDGIKFREFELKAMLKPGLVLSKEDIDHIKNQDNEQIG